MSGLQNRVMEEQVIDWIAERAQHTEEKLVPGRDPPVSRRMMPRAFAGAGLLPPKIGTT